METKRTHGFLPSFLLATLCTTGLASGNEEQPSLSAKVHGVRAIQFNRPIHPSDYDSLQKEGIRILEAVPPRGFLVRLPQTGIPEWPEGVRDRDWRISDKLSDELTGIVSGQTGPGGPITLRVVTYRGHSSQAIRELAGSLVPPRAPVYQVDDGSGRGMVWVRASENDLAKTIMELAAHPDVLRIERYVLPVLLNDDSTWLMQSGMESEGRTVFRNGLTGFGQVVGVADSGLDADACQFRYSADPSAVTTPTGFPQPPAAVQSQPDNKVISYFVIGSAEAYDDATGGFHGTHTVGNIAGDNYENLSTLSAAGHDPQDGMAPGAQIVFQDIGANDGTLRGLIGKSMFDLLTQAYRAGARVHNNSYGSSVITVNYDADSASIDEACWSMNDLVVVFAAGNSGPDPQSLGGTGSTAKNTIVTGASGPVRLDLFGTMFYLEDDLVYFSSQGPTRDNRLKPDLAAPGLVFSATTDTSNLIDLGCCDYTGNANKRTTDHQDGNCNVDADWPTMGTSFSSPLTAGAAALVRQYFTNGFWAAGEASQEEGFNPTNALVKACLINDAFPLTGNIFGLGSSEPLSRPPSFAQGWGRVHLEDALYFDGDQRVTLVLNDTPNPVPGNPMLEENAELPPFSGGLEPMVTGGQKTWVLPHLRAEGLLKVTLAWSDPPATPGALVALVNDMDLAIVSPAGDHHYLGNQEYDGAGHSLPSTTGETDSRNNVEKVVILDPEAGHYVVTVTGSSINGNGEPGSTEQGYALVASGEFLAPTPVSVDPSRGVPDSGLTNVTVHGRHFAPGMELDFGPGITLSDLEVIDEETARVGTLMVDSDAEIGTREVSASLYRTLTGTSDEPIFEVSNSEQESGGCGCTSRATRTGHPGTGMLLLLVLGYMFLKTGFSFRGWS